MERRTFLASCFLCAASARAGIAAESVGIRRLAILHPSAPSTSMTGDGTPVFRILFRHLEKSGYVEGRNLVVDRYAPLGSKQSLRAMILAATETKPDAILAVSGKTVSHLKRLTATIPIIGVMSDPVAYGLVTSLSHPGGNVTGCVVDPGIDIWVKRLSILKEAVPGASKVFYVAPDTTWTTAVGLGVKAAAATTGIQIVGPAVEDPFQEDQYRKAFADLSERPDAVLVSSAAENRSFGKLIVNLVQGLRLPAMYPYGEYVTEGGLMAHDVDVADLWLHAAEEVVEILNGAKPGDIPIYQPRHFRFVINAGAARSIGLDLSPSIVAMADEIID